MEQFNGQYDFKKNATATTDKPKQTWVNGRGFAITTQQGGKILVTEATSQPDGIKIISLSKYKNRVSFKKEDSHQVIEAINQLMTDDTEETE